MTDAAILIVDDDPPILRMLDRTLAAEGYADRVHLGHDAACFYDFMTGDPNFANEKPDYLHISTTILPALLEAGVTQEQIDQMLIANPRDLFARGSAAA